MFYSVIYGKVKLLFYSKIFLKGDPPYKHPLYLHFDKGGCKGNCVFILINVFCSAAMSWENFTTVLLYI